MSEPFQRETSAPELERKVGLGGAVAVNMIEMIGIGPFITIPLIIHAMGGPQAMLGWIFGALFALCDGLVWAELGAAYPRAGGSYEYLKQIYGPGRLGRMLSFLFIWQLSFSAPLSIASGCVGFSQYAAYVWPSLERFYAMKHAMLHIPLFGVMEVQLVFGRTTLVAMGCCAVAVLLCYRGIEYVSRISKMLWIGVIATLGWVIFSGISHFDPKRAFDFPAGAFQPNSAFFMGLGAAMLVATYDYWGYYSVNFFAGEVKDPGRNVPRALVISILAVACIYIVMNISVLGVVPWRELDAAAVAGTRNYAISIMMQRLYGHFASNFVAILIMWTAFASVVSLLLSVSRVPYAAAKDGNYFRAFSHTHPVQHFPDWSLFALGITAVAFCTLRLQDLIAALVIIRMVVQFLAQTIGVIILRKTEPDLVRPFRMWLFPLPPVLATIGFIYVLIERPDALKELRYAALLVSAGMLIYLFRSWRRSEWPFQAATEKG